MGDASQELLSSMPQYVNALAEMVKNITKLLEERAVDKAEREYLERFLGVIENGDAAVFLAKDFSEKDFKMAMQKFGCVCETTRVVNGPNAGAIMCIFDKNEMNYAMLAREIALSKGHDRTDEYGNTLLPNAEVSIATIDTIARDNNETIKSIKGLDEAKAKYIMGELRTSGVVYARESFNIDGEKRYNIYVPQSSDKKLGIATAKANIEYSGVSGNYARQKAVNEIKSTRIALNEIEKNGGEFYVVSCNNPHNIIHVTNEKVTHELVGKSGNKIYREAGYRNGMSDYSSLIKTYKQEVDSMKRPVVLSKEEYLQNKDDTKKLKEHVQSKAQKVIYRSPVEKAQVQHENYFKFKFSQRVFGSIRAGEFEPENFKELLNSVKRGEIDLADFLDLGNDEFAVNTSLDALNKQREELDEKIAGLTDSEYKDIIETYDSYINEFDNSGMELENHIFDREEIDRSINDLVRDIENDKTLDQLDRSDYSL